ncbi:efflux RND transporter permease subunit [Aureimonas altamirensis]|uniref:efflux RND transporter permease subunit n=1 Tax=Aureimonas altamirensis TaxID=370622 RepID=UPI0006892655|nr:efflux RND transporter permease subunit [Aureimonas altamirensis]
MDIAAYSIRRPVNVWLLILVCILGGLFGYFNINRLEDPEFTIKEAVIAAVYPGASAEAVEREVTDVLETAVQRMPQLDEIVARSAPGYSELRVAIRDEFDSSQMTQIWDELRRRVGDAAADLPPGVSEPLINDDFGDVFGMFYAITGEGLTLTELHEAAKTIRRGLLMAEGVGQIEIAGVVDLEYLVEIPQAQLAALGVSPAEIATAIEDAQAEVPGGSVTADGLSLRVSPTGTSDSIEALRLLPIGQGEARILLGDIATIRRDLAEQPANIIRYNGQPAVTLGVAGLSGVNIVDVGEAVSRRLEEIGPEIPLGVEMHSIYDQPEVVDEAINSFVIDLGISLGTVALCLCLAMGLKAGALVSSVLLLSIGGTLLAMFTMGLELERVSLAGLVIAMGMLIDNALVVCDGIQVRMRKGKSAWSAARETLRSTQVSLFGATAIGILAFSGVGLSQDMTGEFLFSLFAVIAISLSLSWVLGLTVVPMLAYYWLAKPEERDDPREEEEAGKEDGRRRAGTREEEAGKDRDERDPAFRGAFYDFFRGVLRLSLRGSLLVIAGAVALTVLAGIGFTRVEQAFFPYADMPLGFVDIEGRSGADIRATDAHVAEVEAWIVEEFPEIRSVLRTVGQGATRFVLTYAPQQPDPRYAQLILMVDEADELDAVMARINRELPERFPGLSVNGARLLFGENPEARIEARFHGPSADVLRALSEEAQTRIRAEGTLENVRDDWGQREIVLRPVLDLERMAELGVTRQDVSQALLAVGDGAEVGVLVENEEQRPIMLRAPDADRARPENILDAMVWSTTAQTYVPLRQVASGVELVQGESAIHRLDRERIIRVRAEPPVGIQADEGRNAIVDTIEAMELPPGYRLSWGGEYETSSDANETLLATMAAPYLIMFVTTVLLFAAFRQALVVWMVVPMSIIGVALGLLVASQPFTFVALLGLLSLTGLLLKNAIVLVEEIEQQIAQGKQRRVAIIEGTTSRVMPILLLAVTTILGMIPLLTDPLFVSMAVAMMGGLGVSAVLTLFVVPSLYDWIVPWDKGRGDSAGDGKGKEDA